MKTKFRLPSLLLLAVPLTMAPLHANEKNTPTDERRILADADYSYIAGYIDAYIYGMRKIPIDQEAYMEAFRDVLENKPDQQTYDVREQAKEDLERIEERQMAVVAKENQAKVIRFLAENAKKPSVKSTPSGLQYQVIKEGRGFFPNESHLAIIEYEARNMKGEDLTLWPVEQPLTIALDPDEKMSLLGVFEGIKLMNVGSEYEFYLKPELAFGNEGIGGVAPGELIIVKIKLLSFQSQN